MLYGNTNHKRRPRFKYHAQTLSSYVMNVTKWKENKIQTIIIVKTHTVIYTDLFIIDERLLVLVCLLELYLAVLISVYICVCFIYKKEQIQQTEKISTQHTELNMRTEHCFIMCAPSNLYQLNNIYWRTACLAFLLTHSLVRLFVRSFTCSFARSVTRST